jgi:hypothetical protein
MDETSVNRLHSRYRCFYDTQGSLGPVERAGEYEMIRVAG